ncbi:hypothetical protein BDR03DRAFT_1019600 [Suillus americanus]|nr:hypothetical protein BDR03DRAFT_1019600 [Suillus americanus]
MSLPLLRFLQMNCDIDFDNVVLSDPSVTESSSSPYLTAADNMLLDPAYWIQHPPRFRYLIQQISTLLPALESDPGTQNHNWVADLFVEDVQATTPAKTPIADSTGSITEPESEDVAVQATTLVPAATSTPGSTTIPPRLERLDPRSFFATPSPPPPDSIYWKYVTREEDSKWYDRAGVDDSFSVVHQRKRELQALFANE